mmetsp:Transcript_28325/g.57107  ORF Transcript_28325/g.57107 Transcript_28325/m.57107 type:complete len:164 (-) Transcript_28325:133-624(-)|eukprot:CAMPEP_0174718108 /NCGR_PEP_ID=MMETSP1094-20130205/28067_1 /TAXON_ID=156173 /ORGANISM="Chrysochromulina brevifilum, Strain UTEX LB 985" /LENGTH=163 /DNA_ID=CAMNT_0015918143 /DNA_START=109 /DNA_END=600 /DNA_ORIENTATION=+
MEDMVTAATASYVAPKVFTYVPPAGAADGARRLNMWKGTDGEQTDSAKYLEAMAEKERTKDKGLVTTFHAPVKPPLASDRRKEKQREMNTAPTDVYEVGTESKEAAAAWEAERDERAAAVAAQAAKRKAKRDKKKGKKKAKGAQAETGDGRDDIEDQEDEDDG